MEEHSNRQAAIFLKSQVYDYKIRQKIIEALIGLPIRGGRFNYLATGSQRNRQTFQENRSSLTRRIRLGGKLMEFFHERAKTR